MGCWRKAVSTLCSAFDQDKAAQWTAVRSLLVELALSFEDRAAVLRASELLAQRACGFSDCLVVAQHGRQGCHFTAAFDRGLRRRPGVRRV